jgi:hypothetical protein
MHTQKTIQVMDLFQRSNHIRKSIKAKKSKEVTLHAMEALGGRGGIAPTHSRPRH